MISRRNLLHFSRALHLHYFSQVRQTNFRVFSSFSEKMSPSNFKYPVARKDTVVESCHGKEIADIYRWLEDPDSEETKSFVNAQNEISEPFLQGVEWKQLNEKLTKLWNYPKYSCPNKHGDKYYYFKNSGLQNQSILYQQDSLESDASVFLDPNELSEDGTIALSSTKFSDDGKFFAYGLSESGSDWNTIKIRDVSTGKDFDEALEKVKFSLIDWTLDNKGFFYGRYPEQDGKTDGSETKQNENQKLYYHRVGTPQVDDVLVAEFPENPSWRTTSHVSDCGKYVVLCIVKDCRDNIVYYSELDGEIKGKLNVKKVVEKFEADYEFIANNGSKFYFRTNKNAPNYRIVEIDFENPAEENWKTVLQEHEKDVLDWAVCVNQDKVLVGYIHDVKSLLKVHNLTTGDFIKEFPLDIGSVGGFTGKRKSAEIFYQFTSFLNPGTIYHYNFSVPNEEPTVFRQININLDGFNKDNYKIDQIFYPSKDGTKIPMFIVRRNTEKITPKPCLLYGYGGFNISIQPSFSIAGLMMADTFDGLMALPNIRGGGEYGEKWHNGGRLFNKQNVFDDFQGAAEYLVQNNYTTHEKIVIQGGSNGGLLVGACINQRPDLFGAAVAQVGVMDMLRFHKFTIGHAWCSDYGNPDEKDHFENVLKYSPLHNVKAPKSANEEYPSTLILTADHDDRVSPLHSLKFAAALQDAVKDSKYQKKPILLRVYSKAGHGAGKPTTKRIEEATDIFTFIMKSLNCEMKHL
ncbi:PREP.2 family protein [Megaselia abdita]